KFQVTTRTSGDTELILALFIKLGPEFVSELNGMFTFAIYDINQNKIYLYRDRLGVKPLFYLRNNYGVHFSSELKGLINNKFLLEFLTINKKAVNLFMHLGFIPHPFTIYNEINKFPSGSYAEVFENNINFFTYWRAEDKISERVEKSYDSSKEQLKDLLEDSVRLRLVSDVPVGAFLSGGIDSSLVTAIAQKNTSNPIKTFSIGFKESKFNESEYARKIASYLKTDHHEYILSEKDAQENLLHVMDHFDEPFADTSALPTYLVSKMARQEVKVVLTGDGGDEAFMGYGAYKWAEILSNNIIRPFAHPTAYLLKKFGTSRFKRIGDLLDINDGNFQSHIYSQEQYYYKQKELVNLLVPEFANDASIEFNASQFNRKLKFSEIQSLFDLNYYLQDDLLVKVDRASMLCSLEAREPLLDYRIIEFSLNLSSQLKKKGGSSKYLLKQVLCDYVPERYFERPKWGFSIPLARWLKGEMHYLINDFLSKEKISEVNILQQSYIDKLLYRFENGEDYLFNRVWLAIVLQSWFLKNSKKHE
ncbi:MAG: asparagine synthase (glutamine-hydrolyzing), partial [Cytophagaceae bacterium]